jgi:hypothetical protein
MHDDEEFPPLPFELCTDQKFTIGILSILFLKAKYWQMETLAQISGENTPFSQKEFTKLCPLWRGGGGGGVWPQVCLLATILMNMYKSVAS